MALTNAEISRLYEDTAPALLKYLARRTLDPQSAVDLMAETFAVVCRDRRRYRGRPEAARVWMFGIADNLLKGFYRSGKIERRAIERMGMVVPPVSSGDFERIEAMAGTASLRAAVAEALGDLNDEQRLAIQMRVVEERSYSEIAGLLKIEEQVVRARVSRGLKRLRGVIENNFQNEVIEYV